MGEPFDHCPPGWIRQGGKRGTQFIHNRMVVDYPGMSSVDFGQVAHLCIASFPRRVPHPCVCCKGGPRCCRRNSSPSTLPVVYAIVVPALRKVREGRGTRCRDGLCSLKATRRLTVPISKPAYFARGSNNRDDEKTVLNELVPTEACRNSSGAGTSLFWSSVVRYRRIL
jgi:hypothetical protein